MLSLVAMVTSDITGCYGNKLDIRVAMVTSDILVDMVTRDIPDCYGNK